MDAANLKDKKQNICKPPQSEIVKSLNSTALIIIDDEFQIVVNIGEHLLDRCHGGGRSRREKQKSSDHL